MTGKCTEINEFTRLLQKQSQKLRQKRIKFATFTCFYGNAQKDKKESLLLESKSPSPVLIPVSYHLRRKKSNSAKAATHYFKKSQSAAKPDNSHKLSSRVTHVLSARVKEHCQPSYLVESCSSSSISSSLDDLNRNPNETDTKIIFMNRNNKEYNDSICCISESVPKLPTRRRTVKTSTIQKLEDLEDICTCSEDCDFNSSTQFFPSPKKIKTKRPSFTKEKKEKKRRNVTTTNQEDNRDNCYSSCSDISTTSSTFCQHPKPRRHTSFGKRSSLKKFIDKVLPTKKGAICKEIDEKHFRYSRKNPNRERFKSSPTRSFLTKSTPFKALCSHGRTSFRPKLQPSECICAESSSSSESIHSFRPSKSFLTDFFCDSDSESGMDENKKDEEFPYDPHMHRAPENPTNNFETLVHLVKCVLGTGILAMPQSFAKAGFIPGTIFTVVTGILITHCLRMLILTQYVICQRKRVPLLNYSESMEACLEIGPPVVRRFSKICGFMVNFFLVILQIGICCIYYVFIANSIKKIVDPYYVIPIEYHMLIILGPLILANCIPNLKVLAPFSAVGILLIIISLTLVMYYLLTTKKKCTEALDLWGSIYTFPLFFGTVLFALTPVAVVTALENNMKTPKDFVKPFGVLNIGMLIIIILYVSIGASGYLFCRSNCSGSIIHDLPDKSPMVIAVIVMYAIGMFISYVLQCFVPIEIFKRTLLKKYLTDASAEKKQFWEYMLRITICILTFIIAEVTRRFGLFASLLSIAALGILTPAVMEMCITLTYKFSITKYKIIIKDIVIFFIGFAVLFIYSVIAIVEILACCVIRITRAF